MGQTYAEKVLSRAVGRPVRCGEICVADVDFVMLQDINGPRTVQVLDELGAERLRAPEKALIVLDHFAPPPTIESAGFHARLRAAGRKFGVAVADVGMGICHQLVLERGKALPGHLVIGTDSHACAYGASGAFGTSMGASETAIALMTGKVWLRIPASLKVWIEGAVQPGVSGKDVMLALLRILREDGGDYMALEYGGSGVASLGMSDRATIASLAVEASAKAGLFPPDRITLDWLASIGVSPDPTLLVAPDRDAVYAREITIDLDHLGPQVACPPSIDNVMDVSEAEPVKVDQVFIGTCTNGRLEDYRIVAAILKGRKVSSGVRCICFPASRTIQLQMMEEGITQTLVEAGCMVMAPSCGPCAGLHSGLVTAGEVVVSTGSRNYAGRMGDDSSRVYLASPATAAASAVAGRLTDPRTLEVVMP
ncbi:MAG: 3-isopropylmalate dehydratase large subunit [Proteobacteria bacterium]|nr:3-isopropylmalate dehydratase large subunit [Pseudomonadota bacterium]